MNAENKSDLEMQRKMLHELEIVEESQNSTKFGSYLVEKIKVMKSQVNEMKKTAEIMKNLETRAKAEAQHGQC